MSNMIPQKGKFYRIADEVNWGRASWWNGGLKGECLGSRGGSYRFRVHTINGPTNKVVTRSSRSVIKEWDHDNEKALLRKEHENAERARRENEGAQRVAVWKDAIAVLEDGFRDLGLEVEVSTYHIQWSDDDKDQSLVPLVTINDLPMPTAIEFLKLLRKAREEEGKKKDAA